MRFLSPPQASSRAASTSNAANVESSEAMEEAMDSGDDKARDSSDEEAPVLVPKNFRLLEATDVEMEPKGGGKKRGRPKGKGKASKTSRIRPNSMAAVRSKAASGYFHPISVPNGEARCQWCKFMPKTSENGGDTKSGDQKRPRAQIFCDTCALNFCGPICFTNCHDVDLAKQ